MPIRNFVTSQTTIQKYGNILSDKGKEFITHICTTTICKGHTVEEGSATQEAGAERKKIMVSRVNRLVTIYS